MAGWDYPEELLGSSLEAIGARLRITREALALPQNTFADMADIKANAYNQYEQGRTRPSIDNALALKHTHRLTLDWIYDGDIDSLRPGLQSAIIALVKARQGQ